MIARLFDPIRQRKLSQNSIDVVTRIQRRDQIEQFGSDVDAGKA